MGSIRARLFLAQLLVVVVAVGSVVLLASRATRNEFQHYLDRGSTQRMGRFESAFGEYYVEQGSWEGVQSVIERVAQVSGERLVLTDAQGTVVADSEHALVGTQPGVQAPGRMTLILVNGVPVGVLHSMQPATPPPSFESFFLSAVNRWLLQGVLVACLAAVALSLLMSRQVVKPVAALTEAARKMEKGDLSQRVEHVSGDEVGELGHAFNAMADALQRGETLRRNMVSDVAHELRTPLSNIRGYLEAARDGVIEADAPMIASLHEEALMLTRLVNDLQELSLAEAGQLKLVRQAADVRNVIQQAVSAMQAQANERGVALVADLPAPLPEAEIDCERIGQVLRNLLANALTYTAEGGSVTVAAQSLGQEIVVSVQDSGAGISAEALPHVFERFYRADKSRTRNTGGSGLGLAIVKQLVEAHGGRVWAESVAGASSTFYFALPVAG